MKGIHQLHRNTIAPSLILMSICAYSVFLPAATKAKAQEEQGRYFSKNHYTPHPLPRFEELRDQLPSPIDDDHPLWIRTYWKAWDLAFKNFQEPMPRSGFVSQFIDAAFNKNIFLSDSCIMSMFCDYAYPLVPGVSSLDNFYARQHEDGEICREISRETGEDYSDWVNNENKPLFSRWGWFGYQEVGKVHRNELVTYMGRTPPSPNPKVTLDALDVPILAWAELEHYQMTAERARLSEVYEPLVQYYRALQKYLLQGNRLYITDWASMDNSPRNSYLKGGGTGIDISSEMVLFARQLAEIGTLIGKSEDASKFSREAEELSRNINKLMWDPKRKFYFDLTVEGKRVPVKTIAAYWTLISRVASVPQAAALASELENPKTFGRMNLVPTLAADEEGYDPTGGYWRGAVWPDINTAVIRGLEKNGYYELAHKVALTLSRTSPFELQAYLQGAQKTFMVKAGK